MSNTTTLSPAGIASVSPWLTAKQAAALMGVSAATVLRQAKAGELPSQLVGRQYRFIEADLLASTKEAASRNRRPAQVEDWRAELKALTVALRSQDAA